MQEGLTVLRRAIQDAQARLRQYESEGDKSKHKIPTVRHAVRSLEEAYSWLQWCHGQKLLLINLWHVVEEGSKASVQIPSSKRAGRSSRRPRSNRR